MDMRRLEKWNKLNLQFYSVCLKMIKIKVMKLKYELIL